MFTSDSSQPVERFVLFYTGFSLAGNITYPPRGPATGPPLHLLAYKTTSSQLSVSFADVQTCQNTLLASSLEGCIVTNYCTDYKSWRVKADKNNGLDGNGFSYCTVADWNVIAPLTSSSDLTYTAL